MSQCSGLQIPEVTKPSQMKQLEANPERQTPQISQHFNGASQKEMASFKPPVAVRVSIPERHFPKAAGAPCTPLFGLPQRMIQV